MLSKGNKGFLSLQSSSGQAGSRREQPLGAEPGTTHQQASAAPPQQQTASENVSTRNIHLALGTFISNRTVTPVHSICNLFLNHFVSTPSILYYKRSESLHTVTTATSTSGQLLPQQKPEKAERALSLLSKEDAFI